MFLLCLLLLAECKNPRQDSARTAADAAATAPGGPWHRVFGPTTKQKLIEDQEKCKVTALKAPVAPEGSSESNFLPTFIACMKASGYQQE
jgi:hypothetical protein